MPIDLRHRRHLDEADVLLMEPSEHSLSILVQIVTTLGAKRLYRCKSLDEAREVASGQPVSLAIVDVCPPSMETYAFVRWMRRETPMPTCQAPLLLTSADIPSSHTQEIFSCGADALVRKPITPTGLIERIVWATRPDRQFVVTDTYVGPERRTPERLAQEAAAAKQKAATQ